MRRVTSEELSRIIRMAVKLTNYSYLPSDIREVIQRCGLSLSLYQFNKLSISEDGLFYWFQRLIDSLFVYLKSVSTSYTSNSLVRDISEVVSEIQTMGESV